MHCEQASALLVDYQRNELAASERSSLALHLQQCKHCSSELQSLLAISQLLDYEQQPSPQARERFLARLQQTAGSTSSNAGVQSGMVGWFQQLWLARPLAAFSYSAALLVVGLLSGQLLPPHALGVGPQVEQKPDAARIVQLCAAPTAPATPSL